jgi:hypothetical protein
MYHFEGQYFTFLALDKAHCELCNSKQCPYKSLQSYLNTFKSKVEVLELYGSSFGSDPSLLVEASKLKGALTNNHSLLKFTKGRAVAILVLTHADPVRNGAICAKLENQCLQGAHQYPTTDFMAAYKWFLTNLRV